MRNQKDRKRLVLSKETLLRVSGGLVVSTVGCPSGAFTHCGCSGINSCGVGCAYTQRGPSCGFGASVCICPTERACTLVC